MVFSVFFAGSRSDNRPPPRSLSRHKKKGGKFVFSVSRVSSEFYYERTRRASRGLDVDVNDCYELSANETQVRLVVGIICLSGLGLRAVPLKPKSITELSR